MLASLKGMLGVKTTRSSRGGEILGSRSSVETAQTEAELSSFDVTFSEQSLGLSFAARECDGRAYVVDVSDESPAFQAGIRRGYVLTHLDGNAVLSFSDFDSIAGAIGRPVTLRFLFSLATDNNGPRVLKNVTVEDKARESRREAMIQAAEARERAWGKKVARASVARRRKEESLNIRENGHSSSSIYHPETLKQIDAVKKSEAQREEVLGFNPFVPVMSKGGTGQMGTAFASQTISKDKENILLSEIELIKHSLVNLITSSDSHSVEEYFSEVNDCFEMLLSGLMEQSEESDFQMCLTTASKIFNNLDMNPDTEKYQSIRVSNPTFQSKVAAFPGGLELMICAGFTIEERFVEGANDASRMFLYHCGSADPVRRESLRFIFLKVKLLQLQMELGYHGRCST